MSKQFNVVVTEEEGMFVALNPETSVASQGETIKESLANLREALQLYFEELGSDKGFDNTSHQSFLTTVSI